MTKKVGNVDKKESDRRIKISTGAVEDKNTERPVRASFKDPEFFEECGKVVNMDHFDIYFRHFYNVSLGYSPQQNKLGVKSGLVASVALAYDRESKKIFGSMHRIHPADFGRGTKCRGYKHCFRHLSRMIQLWNVVMNGENRPNEFFELFGVQLDDFSELNLPPVMFSPKGDSFVIDVFNSDVEDAFNAGGAAVSQEIFKEVLENVSKIASAINMPIHVKTKTWHSRQQLDEVLNRKLNAMSCFFSEPDTGTVFGNY